MVKLTEDLDEIANKYNKTKDIKYKDLWYKLVKEFANEQNVNNINTIVRRNTNKRRVPISKTNGST